MYPEHITKYRLARFMQENRYYKHKSDGMADKILARVSITIHASANKVWKTITNPESIKKYLMGTTVTTNWKEGSPISYQGEYKGKSYRDKGMITKIDPPRVLQSTYWSSMGGKADIPENYNLVTYHLYEEHGETLVTITQNNILSQEEKENVMENWRSVLEKLKELVEENRQ